MTDSGGESTLVDPSVNTDELPDPADLKPPEPPEPPDPTEPADIAAADDEVEAEQHGDTDELPIIGPDGAVVPRPVPVEPVPFHRALIHPICLLVAAVVGGALAVAFHHSSLTAVIAIGVVQGLLIVSWVLGTTIVGRIGALLIGAGAAIAADVLITHRAHGDLGALLAVVGLAPAVMFAHQLLRGKRRREVVTSLSGIALLVVATTALAVLLQLRHQVDGPMLTVAVLLGITAAVVAGHLVDWVWSPLRFDPRVSRGLPALVVGIIAGAVVTGLRLRHSVEFPTQRAVLLGAALAAITGLFGVAAAFIGQRTSAPMTPDVTTFATPLTIHNLPDGQVARYARPVFMTLFVFAFSAPFAYLLCLALRS